MTRQQASSIFKNWKRLTCISKLVDLDEYSIMIETNNKDVEIIDEVDFDYNDINPSINIVGFTSTNERVITKLITHLQMHLFRIDLRIANTEFVFKDVETEMQIHQQHIDLQDNNELVEVLTYRMNQGCYVMFPDKAYSLQSYKYHRLMELCLGVDYE